MKHEALWLSKYRGGRQIFVDQRSRCLLVLHCLYGHWSSEFTMDIEVIWCTKSLIN